MGKIRLKIERLVSANTGTGAYLMILKDIDHPQGNVLPIVIGPFEAQAIILGLEKHLKRTRPLTHDLFADMLKKLGYQLQHVIIDRFSEGIFYAKIHLHKDGEDFVFDARPSDAVALAIRFDAPVFTVPQVMKESGASAEKVKDLPPEEPDEEASEHEEGKDPFFEEIDQILEKLEDMFGGKEGPHIFRISPDDETAKELAENFFRLISSLLEHGTEKPKAGKRMPSEKELRKMLDKAIADEDYERAAKLRDALDMLKKMKNNKDRPEKEDDTDNENPAS